MDNYLTLVGSIVIGGIFLMGIMSFYGDFIDRSYQRNMELLAQETTAGLMEIIDHDFTRMGSGVDTPALAIVSVDTNENTSLITFLGDIDEDGAVDSVTYSLSSTAAASSTENPNDCILYRIVNGDSTINTPIGVTRFRLRTLDRLGTDANSDNNEEEAISMINILLRVESTYPYDQEYGVALWEKRFMPQNLYRVPRS